MKADHNPATSVRSMLYVSRGNIPSRSANSMQTMKMAQAFSRLVPDFKLVTVGDLKSWLLGNGFDFETWYGLQHPFRIIRLPLYVNRAYPFPKNYVHRLFPCWAALYTAVTRPHVVYTRTLAVALSVAHLGVNVVLESHASEIWPPALAGLLASRRFLGIVTISDELKQRYLDAGVPEMRVCMYPDGADLTSFAFNTSQAELRRELELPVGQPVVLYAGHLYESRGIEDIYTCAQALPDCLFVLVGGFPDDLAERRAEVERLGLRNVRLTGFVPNALVPRYLRAADVLLMPYNRHVSTAEWMSPLKLFEYMAAGRPIVASDLPAVRTVLQDGENALLVEPDSGAALARAVVALLDNPALGAALGLQASADVQCYTWDKRAQVVLAAIGNWLTQQSGSS